MKYYYEIVTAYSRAELVQQVQRWLDDGWALVGGVAYADDGVKGAEYLQAMLKTESSERPRMLTRVERSDLLLKEKEIDTVLDGRANEIHPLVSWAHRLYKDLLRHGTAEPLAMKMTKQTFKGHIDHTFTEEEVRQGVCRCPKCSPPCG